MSADIHTLAGAYALDAVDDLERAAFERHLAGCGTCRQEVAELRETAARLADDTIAEPVPVALRDRTLAAARRTPQERVVSEPGRPSPADRRWPRWLTSVAAAIVAAAGASAVTWTVADNGTEQQQVVDENARRVAEVLTARDARVHQIAVEGGGRTVLVVSQERDRGVAVLHDLPAPGAGRAYQLWLIRGDEDPRSVGVLSADATTATSVVGPIDGASTFGLSNEPVGGSATPTRVVALLPLR
ncbi:anti-sigma factor [Micromonospora sp. NPDC048909]|uniref:anti-sigma factor n=1 Tax=Micromonospora sp. NPDC048909 TaxID=3155643 RepID=UPI0033F3ED8A